MIVSPKDADDLSDLIERYTFCGLRSIREEGRQYHACLRYFVEHPQALFVAGMTEYVPIHKQGRYAPEWVNRAYSQGEIDECPRSLSRTESGTWVLLSLIDVCSPYTLGFHSARTLPTLGKSTPDEPEQFEFTTDVETILARLQSAIAVPSLQTRLVISPKLWTPSSQWAEEISLKSSVVDLLENVAIHAVELEDLSWRELEDMVAEILRGHGMEIIRVRSAPQGGRDLIARGQLIPGNEPITIAVEVKHKAVVNRPEVQMALHQNKEFPALMFATSGRFSAGVIEESRKPENQLRLFLRDGIALRSLLSEYRLRMA